MITYGQAQSPVHSILNTMTKCEFVLKMLMGVNGVYLEVCFPNQTSKSNQQFVDQMRKLKKCFVIFRTCCSGSLNCSPPKEATQGLIPPVPTAIKKRPTKDKALKVKQTNKPHCNKKRLWRSNKHYQVSIFGCTCDCWEHFFFIPNSNFFLRFFITSQRYNFFS